MLGPMIFNPGEVLLALKNCTEHGYLQGKPQCCANTMGDVCLRPELFFGSAFGSLEPFGDAHKWGSDQVDTVTALETCQHDTKLCEETTFENGEPSAP